jgi:hypothetical protein
MALHKENITQEPFTFLSPPNWQCGTCGSRPLSFAPKDFLFRDTAGTSNARGEEWFEPEMIVERFVGFARCPNANCGEHVRITGLTSNVLEPDRGSYGESLVTYLHVDQITPAPPIIDIPEKCPDAVTAAITRAFDLYWTDAAAAANAIRQAIEALMNRYGVRKFGKDKKTGARVRIPLHNRIDHGFRKKDPGPADSLLAIKWIGNAGSHEDARPLDRVDVVDAFDLLDHALEELFVKKARAKHVTRITTAVNRAKGPRRRLRKRSS